MVKNQKKAGWRHILVRKELWDELDSLRVLTPDGKEAFGSVIARLLATSQKEPGVNTKKEISKRNVNTHRRRVNTRELSLDDAVSLVERRGK